MLKEAIEKIVELAGAKTYTDEYDNLYADKELIQVKPEESTPDEIALTSLDALVKLIKNEAAKLYEEKLFVTVPKYNKAECFTGELLDNNSDYCRYHLYSATATDVPGWESEAKLPFEQAQIALRTRFQDTPDRDYVMQLISQMTSGAKVTFNDNGIATSVVTQKGVALQGMEQIRPIVTLKPYRTFQEVEQPDSTFLIRVDERGISFIEADGGMWKLAARKTVKAFLEEQLADLIEAGTVVVAL